MSDDINGLKRQTISGLFWKFSERIAAQLVSFVVSIVLARVLMPKEYGVVAIVTIFISLADILVTNGLGATLIQKKDADDLDFNTIFYSGIVVSVIIYVLLFSGAPIVTKIYKMDNITPILRVMGLRIPIAAVNTVQQAYVSRRMDFKKFFFSTFFGTMFSGVVGILMAYNGTGAWALVGQYLTNTVIDTLVLFFTVGWRPKRVFSLERFKILFSFAFKIMITGFIGAFFNQLKGLIIGIRYDSEDLAYYNRGEKFPTLITSNIESSIDSVLFPVLSKHQDDNRVLVAAMRKFIRMASFVIMPMMVGLAVTGDKVIEILLTDKWSMCVPYLRIICVQQIFSILNTANLQIVKAKGQGNTLVKMEFIKKPIMLAIIFISMQWGPIAIACGVTLYELIGACINAIPTKRLVGYSITMQLADISHNLFVSVIMGIVVFFVGRISGNSILILGLQVIMGAVSYVMLSFLIKNTCLFDLKELIGNYVGSRKR